MSFPFSVLNSKQEKIIIHNEEVENESFTQYEIDFQDKLSNFNSMGLFVSDYNDIGFIYNNKNFFYHCNILVLVLTFNIRNDPSFITTPNYDLYLEKILEGINSQSKRDNVIEKLKYQISVYNTLINSILSGERIKF